MPSAGSPLKRNSDPGGSAYAAARLEDIAATVGVTKGTIYFYFESKEKLFAEVIRAFSPVLVAKDAAIDRSRPVRAQITEFVTHLYGLFATHADSRRVFHLLISEGRHFPTLLDDYFSEFLAPALNHLRALLHEGQARGEFPPERVPMAELLIAPAVVSNIWLTVFGDRQALDVDSLLKNLMVLLPERFARSP